MCVRDAMSDETRDVQHHLRAHPRHYRHQQGVESRLEGMECRESPGPGANMSESLGASSVAGSDFDGLSDTTAATPFSSCEGSTGDGPPSLCDDIKVEDNDEEEVFVTHDADLNRSKAAPHFLRGSSNRVTRALRFQWITLCTQIRPTRTTSHRPRLGARTR